MTKLMKNNVYGIYFLSVSVTDLLLFRQLNVWFRFSGSCVFIICVVSKRGLVFVFIIHLSVAVSTSAVRCNSFYN